MSQKKIYLIGNPNVGKTTVFNALTGERQKTGNYIGTTIATVESHVKNEKYAHYTICDIAGVYNFEDRKGEEKIAWNSIENAMMEENTVFVQVINAGQWKQSLSLTLDLQKKGIQPILFFNTKKTDINLGEEFYTILSKELNLHVFYNDVERLSNSKFQEIFFEKINNINRTIDGEQNKENYTLNIPKTFANLAEQNKYISNIFAKHLLSQKGEKNTKNTKKVKISWIDAILLHSFFGILTFFIVLYFIFEMTFTVGAIPMDFIDAQTSALQTYLSSVLPDNLLTSLLVDGIVAGVGGTLIFLPNIVILFFFLSLLKESGYLARTSFLFDIFFEKIGVSGKASVPLLMGFGCNVPSIMAIKSFETKKEQVIVTMMSLFMSCGARLPVYTLLLAVFIPEQYQGEVLFGIYLLGILVSFMTGKLLNIVYNPRQQQKLKSYEMPNLILPNIIKATKEAWQKAKMFIVKAGTFILPVSVVLWGLFTFPQVEMPKGQENFAIEHSYGASIGKAIQPIFAPMDFDWKISTALLSGIAAKEVIVTTFAQLYNATDEEQSLQENIKNSENFSFPTALALIIFVLLYTPCMAVVGVIRGELGNGWALFSIAYPFIIAWIFAFIAFTIATYFL